jgi:creatinine amidohydrolase
VGVNKLAEMTWEEVRALDRGRAVAILPVGAVEAHGPHLPLSTDVIISLEMARRAAERLSDRGRPAVVLEPLAYTPAPFAAGFPGTLSVSMATLRGLVEEIARGLAAAGIRWLCLANSHLDPENLLALRGVQAEGIEICFADKTRRRWVERLTEEFKSGSCHAGRYETSLVMAVRAARTALPRLDVPLAERIRGGATRFEEAGMDRAYCGDPASATAEEGDRVYDLLADMIVTDFLERNRET